VLQIRSLDPGWAVISPEEVSLVNKEAESCRERDIYERRSIEFINRNAPA
jgi:hypothetical protein